MKHVLPIPGNLNHDPARRQRILIKRVVHIEQQIAELEDRKSLIQAEIEVPES